MKTIWKFPLKISDHFKLSVPLGAGIIHVGLDPAGVACVWCEVQPGNTPEDLDLYVIGTGNPIPSEAKQHWGSFVQGPFVWHLYSK